MIYVAAKDTAAIYPSSTNSNFDVDGAADGGVTSRTGAGFRYEYLDADYLRPVFHKDRFVKQHTIKEHPNTPFTKVVPIDVYYNLAPRSRQRLGIVAPAP